MTKASIKGLNVPKRSRFFVQDIETFGCFGNKFSGVKYVNIEKCVLQPFPLYILVLEKINDSSLEKIQKFSHFSINEKFYAERV